MTRASFHNGIKAALHGLTPVQAVRERGKIDVPQWARTYGVTQKCVRSAWESALTTIAPNSTPEGK